MVTKQSLALSLLLGGLLLSGEVAAAPAHKLAPGQASPQMHNRQQSPSSDLNTPAEEGVPQRDHLYGVTPDPRTRPEQRCELPKEITISCEPEPGSALSAFPVV